MATLRIALWNVNGLSQHRQEIESFITNNNIDILLVSETHFTSKNYFNIPKFNVYEHLKFVAN